MAALELLHTLQAEDRPATLEEQRVLARWSSWGAVPAIFDAAREEWASERERLRALLDDAAYAAARRTTVNAHFTDPAYAREMWAALRRLGLDGGRVLEPGSGAGTFIGLAPAGVDLVGVELDPTSAAISRALYPHAEVRTESFAATRLPDGGFDATIGNVPFADVRLYDPRHNAAGHSIHNHFIIKALALTRPGGLVALLTSRYTLDAQNPAARREIHTLADLVGAVRLPSGAHRRAAGTEVVTDLLLLRRRDPALEPPPSDWERTRELKLDDGASLRVNAYYDTHPERILGRYAIGAGQYGAPGLQVLADDLEQPTTDRLADALRAITAAATREGLTFTAPSEPRAHVQRAALEPAEGLWDGHLQAHGDGTFTRALDGQQQPLDVPNSQHEELRALLGLRDAAKQLLLAEAASVEDTPPIDALRRALRQRYEAYSGRYGPINRFTQRPTGRRDSATGQPRLARVVPRVMRTLRSDPFAPLVSALESFDDATQTAVPATLLSQRALVARAPVLGVDTPDEALAVCLETRGLVDVDTIAELLGTGPEQARTALGELVYQDPDGGRLVPAAEYLSGNVRSKLALAEAAVDERPHLAVNVQALRAVVPADLGMDDVQPRLGAAWIDAGSHQAFLREILEDPGLLVEHPGGALWAVRGVSHSIAATSEWGTPRLPGPALAKAVLEQRPIQVTDEIEPGRRVINPVETAAAVEKAEALQQRFAEWVWEEPARATRLLAEYNRRFNAIVLRDYSAEGERLTLPGLARGFQPRPHQRAAVARMLSEPAVGLFHEVGAGKTAEMVIGCMELRRLGLVSKPAVVVPNHMLEQFTREWLQLYPQARLLAASSGDLAGDQRRAFVARVATNDWDAVLMTRSAFERLPVSPEVHRDYIEGQRDQLRTMLTTAGQGHGLTVKRLEKALMRAEAALERRLDGAVDPGINFEATGIDYLAVDELHDYKNLHTDSNIRDAAIDGSSRATDLHLKTEYLRKRHGHRVITGATATPIANSVTEAHVMQRYLRPDLLADAGVLDFDAWAATFGQTVTEIEMAPTGGGNYRQNTRFARFQNVPEMLRMWHVFADVKTAQDLDLPTPALVARPDGQRAPETILIPASPEISAYVAELGQRAEAVRARRVAPDEDNMLKISTDGRKAALDMRLVDTHPSSTTSKLDVASARIAHLWRQHRDTVYLDPSSGQPSPVPGALQLVFCDLGTPRETWNAYDELRDQLAAHGLPREQVRFIHDAATDADKGRLFAAARAGQIAVLVGSTQRMGVGTNVQARAVALHHIDCPWRPADITQRDGRALRQGNQNPEVAILRYVVEGSFDAYSWQTVERKSRFIGQIMRGRLDIREIDDIGDNALSFAEVKALASGDPLILDKAAADADLTRLQRLQRAHQRNQRGLEHTLTAAHGRQQHADRALAAVHAALAIRHDTRGDAFSMRVGHHTATTRADAAELLRQATAAAVRRGLPYGRGELALGELGQLAGLTIDARLDRSPSSPDTLELVLRGLPTQPASLTLGRVDADALSLVRQLEHRISDLPRLANRLQATREAADQEATRAQQGLRQPFKHADALAAATAHAAAIDTQIHDRQIEQAAPEDAEPTPTRNETAEPQRLARANFPAPATATAPSNRSPTPRRSPHPPARETGPSR